MKYEPIITVVIGSYNRRSMLQVCIDAVRTELKFLEHEIIVVDGGSTDGALEWLTKQKDIITVVQHNRGEWKGEQLTRKPWAYFMSLGFKSASGKYICMLSDDSLILPNAILNGLELFRTTKNKEEKLGCVAFYFRDFPIRKKYAVAVNIGSLYVNHGIYLADALKDVGYLDQDYHFYFSDTDLVIKMKQQGYACIPCESSFVEHYFEATPEIRASNNDAKKEEDRLRLINKWKGIAYPESDYEKYKKVVGKWEYHPEFFRDATQSIRKLVIATHDELDVHSPWISVVVNASKDRRKVIEVIETLKVDSYPFKEVLLDFHDELDDGMINLINRYNVFLDGVLIKESCSDRIEGVRGYKFRGKFTLFFDVDEFDLKNNDILDFVTKHLDDFELSDSICARLSSGSLCKKTVNRYLQNEQGIISIAF